MLRAHALWSDRGVKRTDEGEASVQGMYRLDKLVQDLLHFEWPSKEELLGEDLIRQYGEAAVLYAPLDRLMIYCGWDALKELALYECEEAHFSAGSERARLAAERLRCVTMPAARFLDCVESRGLRFDARRAGRELTRVRRRFERCERALTSVAEINWRSGDQVRGVLRREGCKGAGIYTDGTEGKGPGERKHKLDELARAALLWKNPGSRRRGILRLYNRYVLLGKRLSTLEGAAGPIERVDADGRVRPRISIVGTATGRLSSPMHNYDGPQRGCFVASKGYHFLTADCSNGEIAWGAHYSLDPVLVKLWGEGVSLHDALARELNLPLPWTQAREVAKSINFTLQYLGGPQAVKCKIDKDVCYNLFSAEECRAFVERRRGMFPQHLKWSHEQGEHAREHGWVASCFGAVRPLPAAQGEPYGEAYHEALRQAANHPIQSALSDAVLVRAMEIQTAFDPEDLRVIFLKHDEVMMEVRGHWSTWLPRLRPILENRSFYWGECRVPLRYDFQSGFNWRKRSRCNVNGLRRVA